MSLHGRLAPITLRRGFRYEGTGAHTDSCATERGTFGSTATSFQLPRRVASEVPDPYFPDSARHYRLRTDLAPSFPSAINPSAGATYERAAAGRCKTMPRWIGLKKRRGPHGRSSPRLLRSAREARTLIAEKTFV